MPGRRLLYPAALGLRRQIPQPANSGCMALGFWLSAKANELNVECGSGYECGNWLDEHVGSLN